MRRRDSRALPVDRGKQGLKRSVATEARGVPLRLVSAGAKIGVLRTRGGDRGLSQSSP